MSAADYAYQALDGGGRPVAGTLRASSSRDAYRRLSARGLTPLSIDSPRRARRAARMRPADLARFTHQFAALVAARIPIGEGLRSIAAQESSDGVRDTLESLARRIEGGCPIAEALAAEPAAFPPLYVDAVRAAEHSGTLDQVLEVLAESLDRAREIRRQLIGALAYPACILATLGAAVALLLVVVLPRFAEVFAQRGIELPSFTNALLAFGRSVRHWWWAYALAAGSAAVLARAAWRSPSGRLTIDRLAGRIPVLRDVLAGLAVARLARILALCLGSGLDLTEALDRAARAASRPTLRRDLAAVVARVRRGERLGDAMRPCATLPPFSRQMLAAGEEASDLGRMCATVARHHEREALAMVRSAATIVEPVLIVLIAGVVLLVALAIFLPMWDMVNLVG